MARTRTPRLQGQLAGHNWARFPVDGMAAAGVVAYLVLSKMAAWVAIVRQRHRLAPVFRGGNGAKANSGLHIGCRRSKLVRQPDFTHIAIAHVSWRPRPENRVVMNPTGEVCMAKRTRVVMIDDLTGEEMGEGGQTLTFSVSGVDYSIDLSAENVSKFEAALQPYINVAERVGGRKSRGGSNSVSAPRGSGSQGCAGMGGQQRREGFRSGTYPGWIARSI